LRLSVFRHNVLSPAIRSKRTAIGNTAPWRRSFNFRRVVIDRPGYLFGGRRLRWRGGRTGGMLKCFPSGPRQDTISTWRHARLDNLNFKSHDLIPLNTAFCDRVSQVLSVQAGICLRGHPTAHPLRGLSTVWACGEPKLAHALRGTGYAPPSVVFFAFMFGFLPFQGV